MSFLKKTFLLHKKKSPKPFSVKRESNPYPPPLPVQQPVKKKIYPKPPPPRAPPASTTNVKPPPPNITQNSSYILDYCILKTFSFISFCLENFRIFPPRVFCILETLGLKF